MAIAFDSAVNAQIQNPGTSLTFSHTCSGSDRILYVMAFTRNDTTTGVTYNGVSMTQVGTTITESSDRYSIWQLIAPATGANNVVITGGGSTSLVIGCSQSYTGAKQSSQPDNTTQQGPTTTATLTSTLTTVADNSWTALFARASGDGATSAGTGTTQRSNTSGLVQGYDSNGAITPAASTSLQTTQSSQPTTHFMVSIAPSVATTTRRLLLLGVGV